MTKIQFIHATHPSHSDSAKQNILYIFYIVVFMLSQSMARMAVSKMKRKKLIRLNMCDDERNREK